MIEFASIYCKKHSFEYDRIIVNLPDAEHPSYKSKPILTDV